MRLILAFFLALSTCSLRAQNQSVVEKAYESTVVLYRETDSHISSCSGTIVHKVGRKYFVLSAAHCVGEMVQVIDIDSEHPNLVRIGERFELGTAAYTVSGDSSESWSHPAVIVTVGDLDRGFDYSIVSFEHEESLPVSDLSTEPLSLGEEVFGVSSPDDLLKTVLHGWVSKTSVGFGHWKDALVVQMPGAMAGSSGSSIFDKTGKVRAIAVGQFPYNNPLIVAVPVSQMLLGEYK